MHLRLDALGRGGAIVATSQRHVNFSVVHQLLIGEEGSLTYGQRPW
jgi:hypothetical protein